MTISIYHGAAYCVANRMPKKDLDTSLFTLHKIVIAINLILQSQKFPFVGTIPFEKSQLPSLDEV